MEELLTCIIEAVKFGIQPSGCKFCKKSALKREHPTGAAKIGFDRLYKFTNYAG